MSDGMRRAVCRLMFLIMCVLPTVMVLHWIFTPPTPLQWELAIRGSLGTRASVQSVQTPLPSMTILESVVLTNPVNQQSFPIGTITVNVKPDERQFYLRALQLDTKTLGHFIAPMHRMFETRAAGEKVATCRFAKETRLVDATRRSRETVLYNVRVKFVPTATSQFVVINFDLNEQTDRPIVATIERKFGNGSQPASTIWTLDTSNQILPCWMLQEVIPGLASLGPHGEFRGTLSFDSQGDGHVRGQINRIDLSALVQKPFQHEIDGELDVVIEACHLRQHVIHRLDAQAKYRNVRMGLSLIGNLVQHMESTLAQPLTQLPDPCPLGPSQFAFRIQEGSLVVMADGGVVARDGNQRPLLLLNNQDSFPVRDLVAVLGLPGDPGTWSAPMLGLLKRLTPQPPYTSSRPGRNYE